MASASCPFCSGAIDEELARFGGPCPTCFNDVPGDEAATDPGVQAQQAEAEAVRVETKKQSTRTAGIIGVLLTLALASTALLYKQHMAAEAQKQEILSFEEEEMFVVDLDDLSAAEQARIAAEQAAAEEEARKEAQRVAAALAANADNAGSGEEPSTEYGSGDRFTDDGSGGREASAEFQEASLGSRAPTLSIGGGGTDVVRKGAVLTDKAMIEDMAKKALSTYGGQLKQCYEQRLKEDSSIRGAWTIIFMIETNGSTSGVQVQANNKADAPLEACMKRNIENWTFSQISSPFGPIGKTYRFGSRY